MIHFNKTLLRLRVARFWEFYHLRILKIQTHSLSDRETLELEFLGVLKPTVDPKVWRVEKLFFTTNPAHYFIGATIRGTFTKTSTIEA